MTATAPVLRNDSRPGTQRMIGRTVGRYRISEKLGEGGMGVVYRADDTLLNRSVVLKVIRADQVADADLRRRFMQEARAASALDNPHIVKVHDIAGEGDMQYIVMEHVQGQPLDFLIPSGGLPAADVIGFGVQICEALDAAHAAGIVHRDLKPGNIMVTAEGRIKLLDFGLAKLTSNWMGGAVTGPRTVAGSIIGTVSYMSPEQALARPVDARSDLFSLGAILYEMATGKRAFGSGSALVALTAVLRDEPEPPSKLNPSVPAELEAIIARCLQKQPDARYASARAVGDALAAISTAAAEAGCAADPVADAAAALDAFSPRGVRRAVALLEVALGRDASDTRVYQGMAECYGAMVLLGMRDPADAVPKAVWAAGKAGGAQFTLALLEANCRQRWTGMPEPATPHDVRRRALWYLRPLGRFEEAIAALEGDPASQAWVALESGDAALAGRLVSASPADSWVASWVRAWVAIALGRHADAVQAAGAGLQVEPGSPWLAAASAAAWALSGVRQPADAFLEQPHWFPPSAAVPVLTSLRDFDAARDAARAAADRRDPGVVTAVRLAELLARSHR